jgi:hypothetical protein
VVVVTRVSSGKGTQQSATGVCLALCPCPSDAAAYLGRLFCVYKRYHSSARAVGFETECVECCALPVGAQAWLACMRHYLLLIDVAAAVDLVLQLDAV